MMVILLLAVHAMHSRQMRQSLFILRELNDRIYRHLGQTGRRSKAVDGLALRNERLQSAQ